MSDVGRPNEALAKFVEEGIALRKSHSRTAAAKFLDQHGVPFSVIVRVLSEPGKQRAVCQMRENKEALSPVPCVDVPMCRCADVPMCQ